MKTGGWGGPWVTLERPKPPPVADRYESWGEQPSAPSLRCVYWLRQIDAGWRPNCSLQRMGYDEAAGWYGVYIWEYLHVLWPRLGELRRAVGSSSQP